MEWMNTIKIILASASPRRKWLMEEAGFQFEVVTPDVDESFPASLNADQVPVFLAEKKAQVVFDRLPSTNDMLVVAADSVVIHDNKVYEKPLDYQDAYRMLASLSGKKHVVVSGVCLKSAEKSISFSGRTDVFLRDLDHEEVSHYIKTYKPFDKAGAYGIQEWLGHCKISRIEGSYANVMGMPIDLVYEGIKQFVKQ